MTAIVFGMLILAVGVMMVLTIVGFLPGMLFAGIGWWLIVYGIAKHNNVE